MAGIIERNAAPEGMEAEAPAGSFDQNAELAKMAQAMGPEREDAFKRVVLAGKKILYGKETQGMVQEFMATDAPIEEKLGTGIANVLVMMDNQAQGNIPKDVMIPAGTVLLFDAADYLRQSGEKISAQQLASAYEHMFYGVFAGYGSSPEQTDAALDDFAASRGGQQQSGQEAMPGAEVMA
jgi:hypothetical protein